MKGIIKDTIIIFLITLISGLLLGGVYYITKEPISKQEKIAKDKANKAVFSEATSFTDSGLDNLNSYLGDKYKKYINLDEVLLAKANDDTIGYVITLTTSEGYGGDIKLVVGIDNDGVVKNISFLEISETAGLGMNATKDKFYSQFANKKVEEFIYTKTGKTNDNEIDAISSATITTNAVTNGVNAAISVFHNINSEGGVSNE